MNWNRFKQWWATWWHKDPDRYERMARHAAWKEWQHATIVFGGNTIREQWVWLRPIYKRVVWRFTGFIDEPYTEYGTFYDVMIDLLDAQAGD